jgi:hypothetical protein
MRVKFECGAYARSTGRPCRGRALMNGRCRNHGGCSTGPKTLEGRRAVAEATRNRMHSGQQEKALAGLRAWLDAGGRKYLSDLHKARFKRRQWLKRMVNW